jgi:hypothetical protein
MTVSHLTEKDYVNKEPQLSAILVNTMLEDFNMWQSDPKADPLTQLLRALVQFENLKKSLEADRQRLMQIENKVQAYINDIKADQRRIYALLGKSNYQHVSRGRA